MKQLYSSIDRADLAQLLFHPKPVVPKTQHLLKNVTRQPSLSVPSIPRIFTRTPHLHVVEIVDGYRVIDVDKIQRQCILFRDVLDVGNVICVQPKGACTHATFTVATYIGSQ